MIDISVKNLRKSFEVGSQILDGLSFSIEAGERVGILGANGSGKTTLFRILSGEYFADEGDVSIASGKRIGLISQIPKYPKGYTTEDVLHEAHRRLYNIEARITELTIMMATDSSDSLLREYDRLSEDFRRMGGYDMEHERNRVANGLLITAEMRNRDFDLLSGGEKTRVNLARLILEDTDILLLDEPTNHLDLRATEWLEEYISKFHGTVLAISHDRYFLDRVVKRCIEISDGKAELFSGNYSFYVVERQRRFDEQLKKYEKDQAKLEQLTKAAAKLHLWAFMGNDKLHKRAFSMEKRMEKLQQTDKPQERKKLKGSFKTSEFHADEALVIESLQKGFSDKTLFSDVSLEVTGGERIALIGDNGTGKSTLIKMILGEEEPNSGFISLGNAIKLAYLPQIIKFESIERTALDTLIFEARFTPQEARDSLGAFGFSGEDALKPVKTLSGGEQSRLRLCMLMRRNINFLILDEPTNHLDIASREWIEDCIEDYDETLLFVSHDRYFIEKFATRIWAIHEGKILDFRGTFEEYRQYRERQELLMQVSKTKAPAEKKPQRKKGTNEIEKQKRKCEREIEKLETKISDLELHYEKYASDYEKLMELDETKSKLEEELLELYDRWEELESD